MCAPREYYELRSSYFLRTVGRARRSFHLGQRDGAVRARGAPDYRRGVLADRRQQHHISPVQARSAEEAEMQTTRCQVQISALRKGRGEHFAAVAVGF